MLTPDQLDHLFNQYGDGEHHTLTRDEWRGCVSNATTICGYWEWVYHNLCNQTHYATLLQDCEAWLEDLIDDGTFAALIRAHTKEKS